MSDNEKSPEQTAAFVDAVCKHQGWEPNPNTAFRMRVEQGLARNYGRYGYFLCPCRDGEGKRAADKDIVCPCIYAKPDIAEHGHCFCGLYMSTSFAQSGKETEQIPERRPEQE